METYIVGGAVRDRILGKDPVDQDFVITGCTEEELLAIGLIKVGKDFPTFIRKGKPEHQYSLARSERSQQGEAKFDPEVTIEQDLLKRDLTINSIAINIITGEMIDPYGGQEDLKNKILRHTDEKGFMEDPIRILRVARFAARWPDFSVHPSTRSLMKRMVDQGLLDSFVGERVWGEISRGLMEDHPSRMLRVLVGCGAMKVIIPELNALWGTPQVAEHHPEVDTGKHIELCVDYAAMIGYNLDVRYAALVHDLGKGITPLDELPKHHLHEKTGIPLIEQVSDRLKVPTDLKKVAVTMCRYHISFGQAMSLKASTVAKMLMKCDAFRRPERFESILNASICDFRGRGGDFPNKHFPQHDRFRNALKAAMTVNQAEIAERYKGNRQFIADAIHGARVSAIKKSENEIKAAKKH